MLLGDLIARFADETVAEEAILGLSDLALLAELRAQAQASGLDLGAYAAAAVNRYAPLLLLAVAWELAARAGLVLGAAAAHHATHPASAAARIRLIKCAIHESTRMSRQRIREVLGV
jgi:hypothetical protein